MIQNITTVQEDDQDTKHNNRTNRRSEYKTLQEYKQTISIQNIATVLTEDQDTKHNNCTNRRSRYKTPQQYKRRSGYTT